MDGVYVCRDRRPPRFQRASGQSQVADGHCCVGDALTQPFPSFSGTLRSLPLLQVKYMTPGTISQMSGRDGTARTDIFTGPSNHRAL